jgi:VanZ family protein
MNRFSSDMIWPLCIAGTVFVVSGRSQVAVPDVGFSIDKLAHVVVFGMLAISIVRLPQLREHGWRGALIAAALTAGYGALDETRQSFTPGRSVEMLDLLADAVGAVAGVVLYEGSGFTRAFLELPVGRNRLISEPNSVKGT